MHEIYKQTLDFEIDGFKSKEQMVLAGFCTNWRQWKCTLISGAYT